MAPGGFPAPTPGFGTPAFYPAPPTPAPPAYVKLWDSTTKPPHVQISPDESTVSSPAGTHEYSVIAKFPLEQHGKDFFSVLVNKKNAGRIGVCTKSCNLTN